MKKNKIAIIIPYFGEWPPWIDYFLISCVHNDSIDWYFFTDCGRRDIFSENLFFINFTLKDFNKLATEKYRFPIKINNPYKICDFRPAFGEIFEDYLKKYDFWGYADIDIILGDIKRFYSNNIFTNYDIITGENDFIPGHFCILRNEKKINALYRFNNVYKQVFINNNHVAFDEKLINVKIKNSLGNLFFHILQYKVYKILINLTTVRFRKMLRNKNPQEKILDFSSIVAYFKKKEEIKVYAEKYYLSDLGLIKRGEKNWQIFWENGRLFEKQRNNELLYFHFIYSKHRKKFRVETFNRIPKFYINKNGISQS